MFPFWETAIAPVLAAARARRLVEIGALRGEHTKLIIEHLGPETELHVIDPVPAFDPAEHERRFPGQYVFHRDLSLNVLGDLPPMDAALVDGDHNWYTVYNELRLLREVARREDAELPVLFLHDVAWPYGRRDLYYDPDTVPAEHRQPWRQAGMRPGRSELIDGGGLSPTMFNAEHEGGPRNGVMTGLDDFLAEHDKPYRLLVLPIYFGLAIVVEEERLERQPELAAVLDHLDSAEGRLELLELAEDVRIKAMLLQHQVYYQRERHQEEAKAANERAQRATARYLEVVKGSLLNEHYLDHEARIAYLESRQRDGRPAEARILRDPVRHDQAAFSRLQRERSGPSGPDGERESFLPYTAMGRTRLDHLQTCLDLVQAEDIPGDLVEVGTGRGGGAIFMRAWIDAHGVADRKVWVADRFRASDDGRQAPTMPPEGMAGFHADLNLVRDGFQRFGLLDDRVRFLQGKPKAALADAAVGGVAVLRLGRGLGEDAGVALERLYDAMPIGGVVIVDAGEGSLTRKAVDAFRAERFVTTPYERIDSSSVCWRKSSDAPAPPAGRRLQRGIGRLRDKVTSKVGTSGGDESADPEPAPSPVERNVHHAVEDRLLSRAPLAPAAPDDPLDLTVVVVFYNMKREAARTLHSLSRAYQEGIDGATYEVLVLDNGSSPEQRLDPDLVSSFGPEFRLIEMGAAADPSPVVALNRGIREGRGRAYALMIDGAHVLSPGVLRFGLAGLETYAPAIVATQQWYVGPGQQGDAMDDGYDQEQEDRLFATIEWPSAGYRLFEISHFIGDRDWLDGVWESNCMFVTRDQIEQVGGFDESFSMAGGGYANLELYERLGSSPDITVATILGEGSFHQVHGGTTTNQPDAVERRSRVYGYGRHYADLRGRPFRGPGKPIHYVGRITSPAARRTRARRLSAEAFAEGAAAGGVDGKPTSPTPMPEEQRVAFTEAVWRTLPWEHTTWLGRAIDSAPTDLLAYQEIIAEVRPDWVIETGTGDGGRTLYLASICELVGHGTVVSVASDHADDLPQHPRIRYVTGRPRLQETADAVRSIVGEDARALVILGSRADRLATTEEFEAYAPLVPIGSCAVVAETIVNGHPVWPGFGPGPAEAVKQILTRHGEFVPDPTLEKYSLTFNPSGYLRRVS